MRVLNTHYSTTTTCDSLPPAMANCNNQRGKNPMGNGDGMPRPSNGGNISRVFHRGESSRAQEKRANMRRLGVSGDVVAPRFRVSLGSRVDEVVELDLTKERDEMKTRWIAVGLFFSPLPFSNEGLFGKLKSKWGLRVRLNYKTLKNNRYLLEFEREGDRRFILDNGPWTHKGDAFLMAAVDGNARSGDVEVIHMPIWVRIHDVPPIMLDEGVV